MFFLQFLKKKEGDSVTLKIGEKDKYNNSVKLLNPDYVRGIVIPNSKDSIITILVCRKGNCPWDVILRQQIITSSTIRSNKESIIKLKAIADKKEIELTDFRYRYDNPIKSSYDSILLFNSIDQNFISKELQLAVKTLRKSYDLNAALSILKPENIKNDFESLKRASDTAIKILLEKHEFAVKLLLLKNDFKKAIRSREIIIEVQKKRNFDYFDLAASYNNTSLIYQTDGQFKIAFEYQLKALDLFRKAKDTSNSDVANIYTNIGASHYYFGEYRLAAQYFQKTITYYTGIGDTLSKHLSNAYQGAALAYYKLKDVATARSFTEKSLPLIDSLNIRDRAMAYSNFAELYRLINDTVNLLRYQHKAISRQESINSKDIIIATFYNNISVTYCDIGDIDEALKYQNKALEIATQSENAISLAMSYHNLAYIYSRTNNYRESFRYEEKAININTHNDPENQDKLHSAILRYAGELRDTAALIKYHKKRISFREALNLPDDVPVINSYQNLIDLYEKQKISDSSVHYANSLVNYCAANVSVSSYLGAIYNNLSLFYLKKSNLTKAIELGKKSLLNKEKSPLANDSTLGISYLNLGEIYKQIDSLDMSIYYLNKGINFLKHFKRFDNVIEAAQKQLYSNYIDRAEQFRHKQQYTEAIRDLSAAHEIHPVPELLIMIGNCHYHLNKFKKAIEFYKEAYNIDSTSGYNYLKTHMGLAYAHDKQMKKAYTAFKQFEELHFDEGTAFRNWAVYYALNKNKEMTILNLEKAIEKGYNDRNWILTDTSFDLIRDDIRYKKIVGIR
jgi:tetratricopeptide (TPR) repeat protein